LKLKTTKDSKFNFDFSNITSLMDIIDIIKKNDDYLVKGKKYIIDTLLNLSESIYFDLYNGTNDINILIKKDYQNELNIFIDNNKDLQSNNASSYSEHNLKKEKSNSISKKHKKYIPKTKCKKIKININTNEEIENQFKKEAETNENISLNINNIEIKGENNNETNNEKNSINNKSTIVEEPIIKDISTNTNKEEISNNYIINKEMEDRYIYDDGLAFLVDETYFVNRNNLSLDLKEINSLKNMEMLNKLYKWQFFS